MMNKRAKSTESDDSSILESVALLPPPKIDLEKDTKSMAQLVPQESTLLESLIEETKKRPDQALMLVKALGKITKGWESVGSDGTPVNEMPVPQGKSAKDFQKSVQGHFVSGYKLETIFGEEVALITKDSPKWKVVIMGQHQVDSPFLYHAKDGEQIVKSFAKEKLEKLGFILPE
jgi:hypothetical protein